MDFLSPSDDHARHIEHAKDVQAAGGAVGGSHIVIANQQKDRYARIGQTFDPARKFALEGGVRALIFVGVTSKNTNIDLSVQSQIDRLTKLFINADPDNNWVRVPVVNYLRACPA